MPGMRILVSTLFGAATAILLGAVTFIFPRFDLFSLYTMPSQWLLSILGPLIPEQLRAWFGDGPPAGVGLILTCTLLFWTLAFGALHFAFLTLEKLAHKHRLRAEHK
jgi:hypothetical protein